MDGSRNGWSKGKLKGSEVELLGRSRGKFGLRIGGEPGKNGSKKKKSFKNSLVIEFSFSRPGI